MVAVLIAVAVVLLLLGSSGRGRRVARIEAGDQPDSSLVFSFFRGALRLALARIASRGWIVVLNKLAR